MTIDLLSLIVGGILLLLALLTPLMNPFFRRLRKTDDTPSPEQPPVTILLVSNGDHVALDEHLPLFLTQEYGPGYEVIVVTEKADMETENVLKRSRPCRRTMRIAAMNCVFGAEITNRRTWVRVMAADGNTNVRRLPLPQLWRVNAGSRGQHV